MRAVFALVPVLLSTACGDPVASDAVTWFDDVQPIVAENCLSCHQSTGIAPFSLDTYQDAADVGLLMQRVTEARIMPPFPVDNSGECGTYDDARWLTDAEIATIGAWVEGGSQMGEEREPVQAEPLPELERVDVEFDIGTDYIPSGEPDEYRCFVVEPDFDGSAYMTAFELVPGNAEIVHHGILYAIQNQNGVDRAQALDDEAEGPGYPCYGFSRINDSVPIAGWAPGAPPTFFPSGTGILVDGSRPMVLQVHYYTPEGTPEPDRTSMRLTLEDSVDKPALNQIVPLTDLVLQPGLESAETTITVRLGDLIADISFDLLGVFPHMHKRGTTMSLSVERADGTEECVTRVNRWDFDWQGMVFFDDEVEFGPDDIITMTCTYDTTEDTEPVYWGDGTDDEMCVLGIYVTL